MYAYADFIFIVNGMITFHNIIGLAKHGSVYGVWHEVMHVHSWCSVSARSIQSIKMNKCIIYEFPFFS